MLCFSLTEAVRCPRADQQCWVIHSVWQVVAVIHYSADIWENTVCWRIYSHVQFTRPASLAWHWYVHMHTLSSEHWTTIIRFT